MNNKVENQNNKQLDQILRNIKFKMTKSVFKKNLDNQQIIRIKKLIEYKSNKQQIIYNYSF
jgi:CHAT domain-containing protein